MESKILEKVQQDNRKELAGLGIRDVGVSLESKPSPRRGDFKSDSGD